MSLTPRIRSVVLRTRRSAWRSMSTTTHIGSGTAEETLSANNVSPTRYCEDLVRKHDYESYLCSQLYPKQLRGGYFALKAFSVELATVQDVVSNPMIGKMRMQFWRDTVKELNARTPPKHPIGLALYDASNRLHIPSYHLKRIVDARDTELDAPTHLTMDSLTSHAESTSSTMNYALLSLLSVPSEHSETLSHAASHLGVAQTLVTLLRALPYHASKSRLVIPAEITAKHGVNQDEVFRRGGSARAIEDAVYEFATVANDHIITAREMFKATGGKVPGGAMPVFAAAVPVISYLERLETTNFDAFAGPLQVRDWKLPWKMWKAAYYETF